MPGDALKSMLLTKLPRVCVWHFARRATEGYLGRGAVGAGHVDGLGAAIVAGLDVELDVLTLAQAAVAVGLDAGLRTGAGGCQQCDCTLYLCVTIASLSFPAAKTTCR